MAPLHALAMNDIVSHLKFTWIITAFTFIYAQLTHLESVFCGVEPIGFIASGSERFISLLLTSSRVLIPIIKVFRSLVLFINWTRPAWGGMTVTEFLAEGHIAASGRLSSTQMLGGTTEQQGHSAVSWKGHWEEDHFRFRGTGRVWFLPLNLFFYEEWGNPQGLLSYRYQSTGLGLLSFPNLLETTLQEKLTVKCGRMCNSFISKVLAKTWNNQNWKYLLWINLHGLLSYWNK